MGLSGNLRTMALPEILQWISEGRKTGTLHLERLSVQKRISFKDGVIQSSWSNDPRESLGQFLIRNRCVTEEQLFKALLRQESQGQLIGTLLTEDGVLTEEQLKEALRAKVEESIFDLFLWSEGTFQFQDGELPPDLRVTLQLAVTHVILEGIRRLDEWGRIKTAFPTVKTTFKLKGAPHDLRDPIERQALGLVALGKNITEISLEMRRSEFETAALLFELQKRDAIVVDRRGEDSAATPDPVGAIRELLELAEQLLLDKRYDAALKAYEQVLSLDRLNQNAKKGLIAVIETRNRDRALQAVPLTKVPVLLLDLPSLTRENFAPLEGFVLSRVNGEWDVQSILKLCPMPEEEALLIFSRLLNRKVIELREP